MRISRLLLVDAGVLVKIRAKQAGSFSSSKQHEQAVARHTFSFVFDCNVSLPLSPYLSMIYNHIV